MCTKEGLIYQKRKGIQTHAGIIQYVAWMRALQVVVGKFDVSISIGPIDNE